MKYLQHIIFFIGFLNVCFAQAPVIEWQKRYGGNGYDGLGPPLQTMDGGYLFVGGSTSMASFDKTQDVCSSKDIWLVKTNSIGEMQWQQNIGGNRLDSCTDIKQLPDGGYLVLAQSYSAPTCNNTVSTLPLIQFGGDVLEPFSWLLRLDSLGNILWQRAYEGSPGKMYPQPNGDFYVLGSVFNMPPIPPDDYLGRSDAQMTQEAPVYTMTDIKIFKIDAQGNVLWSKVIIGDSYDGAHKMFFTNDGNMILVGSSTSGIGFDKTEASLMTDIWVFKINASGTILWQKTLGGNATEGLIDCKLDSDQNIRLTIQSNSGISGNRTVPLLSNYPDSDVWRVLMSSNDGEILSQDSFAFIQTPGLPQSRYLYEMPDFSGYYAMCTKTLSEDDTDIYISQLDLNGNIVWERTFGGDGRDGGFLLPNGNDGFFVCGSSNSGISGDKTSTAHDEYGDAWIIKLRPATLGSNVISTFSTALISPNPTTGFVNIKFGRYYDRINVSITNVLGQVIQNETITNANNYNYTIIDAIGLYFVKIQDATNGGEKVFKIIKN